MGSAQSTGSCGGEQRRARARAAESREEHGLFHLGCRRRCLGCDGFAERERAGGLPAGLVAERTGAARWQRTEEGATNFKLQIKHTFINCLRN